MAEEANNTQTIRSFSLFSLNQPALMDAVSKGPVAISVAADGWEYYNGGIFDNCGATLDHAVQLVGYGTEDGQD